MNAEWSEDTISNAWKHSLVVGFEGAYCFGVGGMIGSFGKVGSKGGFLTKEWRRKLLLGQEFSLPMKYPLDKLRKGLWN